MYLQKLSGNGIASAQTSSETSIPGIPAETESRFKVSCFSSPVQDIDVLLNFEK
jgi:predicted ATP-dependent Lon-type protease